MQSLKFEDAIRAVAKVGFDGIEVAARPDWDSAPQNMSRPRRREVRELLAANGLEVTALMDRVVPSRSDDEHSAGLETFKQIAALGRDLSPDMNPPIQTVLGGGKWEEKRDLFVNRLGDWAELGEQLQTVIAIKPHRGGAMSKPSEAAWLIQQLDDTPWIQMVYDYSHYAFRDMPLEKTVQTALPYTAHIAIKDTVKTEKGFRFVLPGESKRFDYAKLLKNFYSGGYRGDVCCEVSAMVWTQSNYDPIAAAETCYANIAPVFKQAKIPRRS